MQIEYEIKKTEEYGQGVFTKQDISKGTLVYCEDKGKNKYYNNVQELRNEL